MGRTSMVPRRAIGMLAAMRTASLRSRASMMMKPERCSLVSANGPSVVDSLPSRTRTEMAADGASSALAKTQFPLRLSASSLSRASLMSRPFS